MKKVLVVDDEESIRTLLQFNLQKEGYQVTLAEDGQKGLALALQEAFDFIILDVMLPYLDGMEITKKLRQEKVDSPILMLTAKDDAIDRILGLEIGADDYLTKPFSPRQTPIHPIVSNQEGQALQIGEIIADLANYQVQVRGQEITLTPKEFELLVYFMQRKNRVINRDTLLERIWNFDFDGQTRIVDVHISHLREKIEVDPKKPQYLVTVRGFGYKFQEPDK